LSSVVALVGGKLVEVGGLAIVLRQAATVPPLAFGISTRRTGGGK
jgi:hypothetical protein